jgi:mono/diheme cytochrome c family protein
LEREVGMRHGINWRAGVLGAAFSIALAGAAAAQYQGWTIPEGAKEEKSPLANAADAAKKGKTLYAGNCAKCHGPEGKGDGPDSDHAADLTDEFRTELNPEGVLYYKIWNGHANDMPAFKSKLTKDDVWSLVAYLKELRGGK